MTYSYNTIVVCGLCRTKFIAEDNYYCPVCGKPYKLDGENTATKVDDAILEDATNLWPKKFPVMEG